ncbi:MAG TPA: Smr/MutS family protein [Polyangia bacterium]|nr:Smr/MutS family protein [Polyangia bacterium]
MSEGRGDDDDTRTFEQAMRGARALDARAARVPSTPARRGPAPRLPRGENAKLDVDAPIEGTTFTIDERGETISARANGVDARTLRALAAGDPPVEARLDLHGMPRERALAALARFVAKARADGRRAALVIHGRGAHSDDARAVLKPLVWRWLATTQDVLAFTSARAAQGGDGATILLLRRR